jgi:serine/threonine-protein kinase
MQGSPDFDAHLREVLGDSYDLERELPGSGMSRVFVATERALGRKVVIKVLPPELAAGVNRERFRREIQLAAQLQHPHIVPLHAAGVSGDLLYFTMPFIDGESLRHALLQHERFTPRDVVHILRDVADALAHAHARGVIHRDIKPGNVLRSGSHAMVTDFGVAKAISAAMPNVSMTTSGMAIGTPQYMAPEQLAGDPAADHRVDIYAVGLLGYELLTGEAPFKADSPQETMAAQLTRVPDPITRRRPDAPPALATLLARCLAKQPDQRPQSATELVALLDELALSSGGTQPMRSGARGMWAAAGVVLAGVVLAAVLSRRDPVNDEPAAPPPPAPAPSALTREDSLAIARAIDRKYAEQRAVARAEADTVQVAPSGRAPSLVTQESIDRRLASIADSLRTEIQKAVLDSITRERGPRPEFTQIVRNASGLESLAKLAERFPIPQRRNQIGSTERRAPGRDSGVRFEFRAPDIPPEAFAERAKTMGPPRRVLVADALLPDTLGVLRLAAEVLIDSLRSAIGRESRYSLIPQDSVRAMLGRTRNIRAISEALQVELMTSIILNVQPDNSVIWTLTVRDLTAHPAFATRSTVTRGPPGPVPPRLEVLVSRARRYLDEMDRAPRRPVQSRP